MGKRRWYVLGGVALALVAGAAVWWSPMGTAIGALVTGAPVAWKPRPVSPEHNRAIAELIDQGQPPEGREPGAVNGYPLLIQAAARYQREFSDVERVAVDTLSQAEFFEMPNLPPEPELRAIGRQALVKARDKGLLALMDQAAAAPRMVRAMVGTPERAAQLAELELDPALSNAVDVLSSGSSPEFSAFRALVRLAWARMTLATGTAPWIGTQVEPNPAEFVAGVRAALAMGRAKMHQDSAISRASGQAVISGTVSRTLGCLRFVRDDAALSEVAKAVEDHVARTPLFSFALKTERALERRIADQIFNESGQLDVGGWYAYQDVPMDSSVTAREMRQSELHLAEGLTRDVYLKHADALNTMISEWWKPMPEDRGSSDEWRQFVRTEDRHLQVSTLRLAFAWRVVEADDEATLGLLALTTAVAVERYRIATGNYPADLSAVVGKGLLPAVPRDAIARAPLGYRRLDTPDAQGRPYLLYSIGADGVDDGAQRLSEDFGSERQSALFGPAPTPTVDVLLN